jgi:hypothetical protein
LFSQFVAELSTSEGQVTKNSTHSRQLLHVSAESVSLCRLRAQGLPLAARVRDIVITGCTVSLDLTTSSSSSGR